MNKKTLTLLPLTCIVMSSMLGSGIFDIPKNMAESSGVLGVIIAWTITGFGMLMLSYTFQRLASKKSEIEGVYAYAKVGFGDYLGFNSAWGYWISAILANLSYIVILFSALGYFFPIFGEGNTLASILGGSILIWSLHFLLIKGVKEAAFVNIIVTITKIVPLVFFLLIVILAFKVKYFNLNFHPINTNLGSLFTQVKKTMLVTVWAFIGIEGASVYLPRAKNIKDVGRATLIGFFCTLTLLFTVSLLSLGTVPREQLASMASPSLAGILELSLGKTGVFIINIGLILSLIGALLSWTLLATELPYIAAQDGSFPLFFKKENKNNTPSGSLIITSSLTQVFLIFSYFYKSTYGILIQISSGMILIPYLLCALYYFKIALNNEHSDTEPFNKKDLIIAGISSIYGLWLIYAGGISYLFISTLLYAPGTLLFIWAKKSAKVNIFKNYEKVTAFFLLISFILAIYFVANHKISF